MSPSADSLLPQQTPLWSPYDFSRGHPNDDMLPVEEMRETMIELASGGRGDGNDPGAEPDDSEMRAALNYRPEAGSEALRSELRAFLDRRTADDDLGIATDAEVDGNSQNRPAAPTDDDRPNILFMTNGVSHGVELLCRTQTRPGDVVLVERPTYFLASGIFHSHGLVVRGLPMNPSGTGGADVDRLIRMVESGEMEAPRMIYLIPTHQNPTGRTMPAAERRCLAEFAKRRGVLIVADEVYHLLDWRDVKAGDRQRPARMAAFNGPTVVEKIDECDRRTIGCCVSVSAFTKIFAPGVRCGWIEAPEPIVQSLVNYGYVQSQGGLVPFMGDLIMRRAMESGRCDSFLDRLRAVYGRRAQCVCDILAREERITVVNRPLGGYFLWVRFPHDVDTEDLLEFCRGRASESAAGVRFRPGVKCDGLFGGLTDEESRRNDVISGVTASSLRSCARLCFADLDEEDLYEGARRLVAAFREYMTEREEITTNC